jgi:hypothetical protein
MKHAYRLILLSLITVFACPAGAQDYSGTWIGTVTESSSSCKNIVKAAPGDYRLTFTQRGNELTIVPNTAKRLYVGVLNAAKPGFVQVRGTYPDDGGLISEEVSVKFTGNESGEGQSAWRWANAWHQCGGRFLFTLKKKGSE